MFWIIRVGKIGTYAPIVVVKTAVKIMNGKVNSAAPIDTSFSK